MISFLRHSLKGLLLSFFAALLGFVCFLYNPFIPEGKCYSRTESWDVEEVLTDWDSPTSELTEMWPNKVTASSVLKETGYDHSPQNLLDYDEETDWCEGVTDTGAGEYVEFTFTKGTELCGFSILPGFYKSQKLFNENAAPLRINLRMGDFTQNYDLTPYCNRYGMLDSEGIYFPFPSTLVVDKPIRLLILSVREGTRYGDCSITEVHFFGEPDDSFYGVSDWKTEKVLSLTKKQIEHLVSFSYNLYRFRRNGAKAKKGILDVESLTDEEIAYGLYWYTCQNLDDRLWSPPPWSYHAGYTQDFKAILTELFPGASSSAWSTFRDSYVLWREGTVSYVQGDVDLDFTNSFVFSDYLSRGIVDKTLLISGNVCSYDEAKNRYVAKMQFQAYFVPAKTQALYGWQFQRLEIE